MNLSTTKTVAFIAMLFVLTMQKSYPQGCSLSSTNTRSMPFNFYGFNGANLITLDETPLSGPCSGTGWAGFCLKESILDASFTELRYPAGTVSNYWDWYHGWFLPNRKMPTGYCLEQKYENYAPTDCKIPTFAIAVKKAGVTPIFDLNLMTSDKLYQGAMLYIARALNLSVQNLEMGNEFYHDNKLNVLKYPTPDDHIIDANAYLSFINSHFPTGTGTATPFMKSALVGAVSINEPSFSRRNTWLNDLANGTTIDCDAITLHNYTQSGLGTDKMKMDGSNLHVAFHTALTNMISGDGAMNQAMTTINGSLSNGKEIWATEYNLQDGGHLMVGTWAHGLHTITMGMTYLENLFNGETLITKADCHALVGNASSHALFENELGFALDNPDESYYHDFLGTVDCLTNDWEKQITTTPYTLTASGIALKILGNATEGATTATINKNKC